MKAEQNNFVDIRYAQNGASSATNELGMREMQAKAYKHRTGDVTAMTGSYFRGDGVPVIRAEDEARFYPRDLQLLYLYGRIRR